MNGRLTREPVVLIVGEMNEQELSEVCMPLATNSQWRHISSVDAAVRSLAEEPKSPDVIVLVQSRPGEIGDNAVRELQNLAPLAGMYAVLGSWCEGEARTGKPWPGVTRCYSQAWPSRWREELDRLGRGELPMWTMPFTSTDEERLLGRGLVRVERARDGCVVVVGASRETRRAISEAVKLRQSCVLECGLKDKIAANGVTAIIWDTTRQSAGDPEQVALLKARFHDAPILALVTFPRRHELQRIVSAGVEGVLAKPWLIDDLLAQIEQLAERRVAVG